MTAALLLDTHIALWLDSGDERLRASTRALIGEQWSSGGTILLSAVSVWEIAALADRNHIILDRAVESWVTRFLERPGVEALPLDYRSAASAYELDRLEHRDPADRLLIASAIVHQCPLVSYDRRIQAFGDAFGTRYRFRCVY